MTSQALSGRFVPDTTPVILGGNGNGAGDANVTERFPGASTRSCSTAARSAPTEIAQLYDGALFASAPVPTPARATDTMTILAS